MKEGERQGWRREKRSWHCGLPRFDWLLADRLLRLRNEPNTIKLVTKCSTAWAKNQRSAQCSVPRAQLLDSHLLLPLFLFFIVVFLPSRLESIRNWEASFLCICLFARWPLPAHIVLVTAFHPISLFGQRIQTRRDSPSFSLYSALVCRESTQSLACLVRAISLPDKERPQILPGVWGRMARRLSIVNAISALWTDEWS